MKELSNQKWKVGNHLSVVVTDTKVKNTNYPSPPNPKESTDDEIKFYGGYLVCESIGNVANANLIASAPALLKTLLTLQKYMLKKGITLENEDLWNEIDKGIKQALGK